jgi:hypothetical protein
MESAKMMEMPRAGTKQGGGACSLVDEADVEALNPA